MNAERNAALSDRLKNFGDMTVLVVGDVMLDEYLIGEVNRISPEAPVPVLKHSLGRDTAGGAANVALNVASLGGKARLIGIVGDDQEGRRLKQITCDLGVVCDLIVDRDRPTITKTRVLAGSHQIVRIDKEDLGRLSQAVEDDVIARSEAALDWSTVVILSDYGKGCLSDRVLSTVFKAANAKGVPVLVDPKRRDFAAYRGATYIKPNRSELALATGLSCMSDDEARIAAHQAAASTGAHILLTRSEQGMALFTVDGEEHQLSTDAVEVFDVSGAGDTVIATFALATATGAPPLQAMRVANAAASVVVSKAGTAVLTIEELDAALGERDHADVEVKGQLVTWQEAAAIRESWRKRGLTVGFTNGCFDLIHPGHVAILRGAAGHCERLIVGLNTDASVARLKGPSRPIQSESARAEVVGAMDPVDLVVLFDEPTPLELITALIPDVLVKGADYAVADIVGADVVLAAGGSVETVELRVGHSTTNLVRRSGQ